MGIQIIMELERSSAAAIFLFGAQEIIFVGHHACKWGQLEMSTVTDTFRKQGVNRQAFGDADLRKWFGAFHNPGKNVQPLVERISESPRLPVSVLIHVILLDDATGKASILIEGMARVSPVTAGPEETAHDTGRRQASPSSKDSGAIAAAIPPEKPGEILKGGSQYAAVPSLPKRSMAKGSSAQSDESVSARPSVEGGPETLTDFDGAFLYLRETLTRLRSDNNLKGRVADLRYRLGTRPNQVSSGA